MRLLFLAVPEDSVEEHCAPSFIGQQDSYLFPPLGLLYLASNVDRTKHEVKVIDAIAENFTIEGCVEHIREYEPDVLAMTTLSYAVYPVKKIAEGAKRVCPDLYTVLGGPHINVYPMETLGWSGVDFCITQFAESSLPYLLDAIEKDSGYEDVAGLYFKKDGIPTKSNKCADSLSNLDLIKMPDRRLTDHTKYYSVAEDQKITTMITSRGCPFKCTFCDVFEKKVYFRSAENVMEELKDIVNLGIKVVNFFDDNFNFHRKRVIELCRQILKENIKLEWTFRGRVEPIDDEMADLMYKAGCRRVHLGIETGTDEGLKRIKKQITIEKVKRALHIYRKHKIKTLGFFIIGFPHETKEDCEKTCEAAARLGFDYIFMFTLAPYPETAVYREVLSLGAKDHWIEHAKNPSPNYRIPNLHPTISEAELSEILDRGYRRFYLSPKFILKELIHTRNLKNFSIKAGVATRLLLTKLIRKRTNANEAKTTNDNDCTDSNSNPAQPLACR
jgi:anaerobic magnesium-protoporphyrin IX monomethyl ester cyclase